MTREFFSIFLVPAIFRMGIDFDRDFLCCATVAFTLERAIANAARDAVRHPNHLRFYCAPHWIGYAPDETEALGSISCNECQQKTAIRVDSGNRSLIVI